MNKNLLLLLICLFSYQIGYGQSELSDDDQKTVLDSLFYKLEGFYIYPEKVDSIKLFLTENYDNGKYKEQRLPSSFASSLTGSP